MTAVHEQKLPSNTTDSTVAVDQLANTCQLCNVLKSNVYNLCEQSPTII